MEDDRPKRTASGRVTADPLIGQPIGAEVHFKLLDPGFSNATDIAQGVSNWEYFHGAVLAFALKSVGSLSVVGTAVMVAPGLALTATHNFLDAISEIEAGKIVPYCMGLRPTSSIEIWNVRAVSYDKCDDLALLALTAASQVPDDRTYYRLGVTTRAPAVGEELDIIGFRAFSAPIESGQQWINGNFYAARGSVAAVYPDGRDRVLLPYPAIEVASGSHGGMSGGAAFDRHKLLVGLVSRGLSTEDGKGPTYVSWIITALNRFIEIPWPPGFYKGRVSPLSIDRRILFIDRPEAITEATETGIIYKAWS